MMTRHVFVSLAVALSALAVVPSLHAGSSPHDPQKPPEFFEKYCFECHGDKKPEAQLSLTKLVSRPSVGPYADDWEGVAEILEAAEMPPEDADVQPSDAERKSAASWVRRTLKNYELAHAGEPGHVTVRRLTSGEYSYAIRDLTGIDIPVGVDASSDSVGGEGFTNFGDVQFVQDATIERFLEAAKDVADHAVVGAGPLRFSVDAGKTGVELAALNRINEIYAKHGFRVVSGEGGRPFGLDRYGKAFFVSWYFQNRNALGDPKATLANLATKEGITPRFAQHIWSVVTQPKLGFPSRLFVDQWKALPKPGKDAAAAIVHARASCDELYQHLTTWPSWFFARGDLAAGGEGDESPLEFDDEALKAEPKHSYTFRLGAPTFPPAPAGVKPVLFMPTLPGPWNLNLSFDDVNPLPGAKPMVIWRNPRVIVRAVVPPEDKFLVGARVVLAARQKAISGDILATIPLRELLPAEQAAAMKFGVSPDGSSLGPNDFVATSPLAFKLTVPEVAKDRPFEAKAYFFEADVELGQNRDAVMRIMVSDAMPPNPRDKRHRILIGDPASPGYRTFRNGMAEYVAFLPPNSHGEANPADKDPVPQPFDNTYNGPEKDAFISRVKYQRNDAFFAQNLVDGAERDRLNEAWNDLFSSWPYHDAYVGMLVDHYSLKLKHAKMENWDDAEIAALPAAPRGYLQAVRRHYLEVKKAEDTAEPTHLGDALAFASRAWRRPLTDREESRLKEFYQTCRKTQTLDHDDAIKALITRVLVSPAFLYRVEAAPGPKERELDDWEMASRLSFFLWSSIPDEELRRAAAAGELHDRSKIAAQVKRMTADPKARRLATEFFGQWFGFYRFDQFRGVDTGRFPEFNEDVQTAMYDEAVSTFEYIVRENRPIREILYADYTFLNQPLAKFYGIDAPVKSATTVERVDGAHAFNRGGVLRLGSVLTTTSAPLRTSPVKRGDWVLRRILGTPTPPPPPNAGTLPSDPKSFGGLTLRQKLDVHKRDSTCANCHLRIDPLGFPLEGYDAIGRTRLAYQDGGAVDTTGEFADKTTLVGVEGLLGYLQKKDPQIMKTLSKKMMGYALGRTVLASDRPLLNDLIAAGGGASFADLATKIVTSRQFLHHKGQTETEAAALDAAPGSLARIESQTPTHETP